MSAITKTFIEFHPQSWEQAKNVASNYSNWIFRGQNNAAWGLETSIQRAARIHNIGKDNIEEYERSILLEFQRQAHNFISTLPKENETVEWLSRIQHHGGPTRLLDFTFSFYIASYFALQGAEEDAAVWCVNKEKLDHCVQPKISMNNIDCSGELLKNQYICNRAVAGDVKDVMAIPVEPFYKNTRIAIQQGLFVFPFDITETFENNIFSVFSHSIEDLKTSVEEYEMAHMELGTFSKTGRMLKVYLKKEFHGEIRKDLARMNISSASLFPGLDGFAKSLASCMCI